MSTTLISGATGFVGQHLVPALLADGQSVLALTRTPEKVRTRFGNRVTPIEWNFHEPLRNFPACDAVVHLAGESLFGKRWNKAQREVIRSSRIDSTKQLVAAIAKAETKPAVLVCASAVGVYGDRGDEELTESSPGKSDFLADLCGAWENTARLAEAEGVRVVNLRTGIVLGPGGGALEQLLPPFRRGFGGPVGTGDQWMSWIHLADAVALIKFAMVNAQIRGPLNLTSPQPVTNREFSKLVGESLGKPANFHTPAFALRLLLGDVADVVLSSQRVIPKVAREHGYHFQFSDLKTALTSILKP